MKHLRTILLGLIALGLSAPSLAARNPSATKAKTQISKLKQSHKINLNTVDAKSLAKGVKGFGRKRAADIVAYRNENGPFTSIDDLEAVKGISKRFLIKKKSYLQSVLTVG